MEMPAWLPAFRRGRSLDCSCWCFMKLLCSFSAVGLKHIRKLASLVAANFVATYTFLLFSLFRTSLSPAHANKTAERAALHFGCRCYCEITSYSLADFRWLFFCNTFNLYSYYFSPCGTKLTAKTELSAWTSIRQVFAKYVRDYFINWLLLVYRI